MSASVAPVQNGSAVTAAAPSSSTSSASGKPTAAPTEVGWLFVPQYYTFLNNDPSKLHCFYSKRSTLVHGTEQEEAPLCIGQQQIHEKIVSLGFSNAKVYVSNVDSQASASGGIIIQVLGDISNNNGPWRKFVQTFFLAEQPNGYFVLNDIFRYLKEDEEVEEDAQDAVHDSDEPVQLSNAKGSVEAAPADVKSSTIAPSAAISAATSVSTAPLDTLSEAQANGIVKAQEPTPAAPSEIGIEKKVTTVEREDAPAQTRGEIEASQAVSHPAKASAPTPALNAASSNGAPALSPAAAAAAAAPALPKTWANLAASNATKWGSTVNAESRGISSAREATSQQSQSPQPSSRSSGNNNNSAGRHVFIKNVVAEKLPSEGLQAALEAKFGPMKECQVVAAKGVAFGEFVSVDSARKAIRASGEGGVKIGKDGHAIMIEEKRKPADRGSNSNNSTNSSGANRGGRGGSSAQGQSAGRGGRGASRGGASSGGRGGRSGAA